MSSVSLASLVAATGGAQPAALPGAQLGTAIEAVVLEQIGTLANMPVLPAAPASAQPADVATVVQSLATAIVRDAAARQNGLAPLYADLEAALARPDASLPQPVRAAAGQLLALRLDPGVAIDLDANDIKTALAQAGLAAASDADGNASPTVGSGDLKSALLSLQGALKSWIDDAPTTETATTAATEPAAAPPSQAEPQPAAATPADTPTATPAATPAAGPMPPYRNAPTGPQAPAAVTLPPDAAPPDIAVHLLAATNAALPIAIAPDGAAPGNSLAPLYADLEAVLAQPAANLPQPVRTAANQLLGLRPDPGVAIEVDSNNSKSTSARAGLAAAADTSGNASSTAGSGDLQGALQSLQDALQDWIDGAAPSSTSAAAPASTTAPAAAPPSQTEPQPPDTPAAARGAAPMPPYRNAPTVPQAPAATTVPPDAAPRDLACISLRRPMRRSRATPCCRSRPCRKARRAARRAPTRRRHAQPSTFRWSRRKAPASPNSASSAMAGGGRAPTYGRWGGRASPSISSRSVRCMPPSR